MRHPELEQAQKDLEKEILTGSKALLAMKPKSENAMRNHAMLEERITQIMISIDILDIGKDELEARHIRKEVLAKLEEVGKEINVHMGHKEMWVGKEEVAAKAKEAAEKAKAEARAKEAKRKEEEEAKRKAEKAAAEEKQALKAKLKAKTGGAGLSSQQQNAMQQMMSNPDQLKQAMRMMGMDSPEMEAELKEMMNDPDAIKEAMSNPDTMSQLQDMQKMGRKGAMEQMKGMLNNPEAMAEDPAYDKPPERHAPRSVDDFEIEELDTSAEDDAKAKAEAAAKAEAEQKAVRARAAKEEAELDAIFAEAEEKKRVEAEMREQAEKRQAEKKEKAAAAAASTETSPDATSPAKAKPKKQRSRKE